MLLEMELTRNANLLG